MTGLTDENHQLRNVVQQMHQAAAASSTATKASRSGALVDTRMAAKPSQFDGQHEHWYDWSFTFKAYCGAISGDLRKLMEYSATSVNPIGHDPGNEEHSRSLYYMLVMSCREKALKKLRSVLEGHGLEAWRIFNLEWEPRQQQRFTAMLTSILRAELEDPIESSLDSWEDLIRRFEQQSGETIADSIKASVICHGVKNEKLREHLALNAARLTSLTDVRDELRKISQAQRTWTVGNLAGQDPMPMEIGAVQKGKGKGKSKGKKGEKGEKGSKGGKGGKGEQKGMAEDRECFYCKKAGHLIADCRKKKQDEQKDQKRTTSAMQPEAETKTQAATTSASHVTSNALQPAWSSAEVAHVMALLSAQAQQRKQLPMHVQINALNTMGVTDAEDEFGVFMLQEIEENVPVSSVVVQDGWMLWDSGSGLTTCGINDFDDVVMTAPKKLPKMQAATGHGVEVYGARTVRFETPQKEILSITFQVSNVTMPILAADAFLDAGCAVEMDGAHNLLRTPGGSKLIIERRVHSWWLKLKRVYDNIEEPNLVLMALSRPSAGGRQLPIAVEQEGVVQDLGQQAASSGSRDPLVSVAHEPVAGNELDSRATTMKSWW